MFRDNIEGTVDFFAKYIYPGRALQPEFQFLAAKFSNASITAAPEVHFTDKRRLYVTWDATSESTLIHQIAIYKWRTDAWSLYKVLPTVEDMALQNTGLELESGHYAATLVDRFGRESDRHFFKV